MTLRAKIRSLQEQDPGLVFVACGMVEDLTGFFVAGAGKSWLQGLGGSVQDRAQYVWYPSEWPAEGIDPSEVARGRVTAAIWELSGTQAMLDGTGEALNGDAYDALRESYVERIVLAIRRLRDEGALRRWDGQELWIWLHSADAFDEALDDKTFPLLQGAELSALFSQRWDGATDTLLERAFSKDG